MEEQGPGFQVVPRRNVFLLPAFLNNFSAPPSQNPEFRNKNMQKSHQAPTCFHWGIILQI
ncbi:rCG38004 [Rattus norvegicus]|uniref:RCG38004 n=1 Tax=Rattus norvegicus TaxID=10116 RepID=A6IVG6_RAT|nr:rCG38004 [Rattus norvegicus]